MSYILDALRRADNEREHHQAPGIYDTRAETLEAAAHPGRDKAPWLWMAVGAVAVLAIGALGWLFAVRPAALSTAAPVAGAAIAAAQPIAAPPPLQAVSQPAPTIAVEPPLPRVIPPPLPQPEPAKPQPGPERALEQARPAPPSAAPAVPETRLPGLAELPEELRHSLPKLSFDGTVYSEDVANRILMLNGQLLREGETYGPDIRVERIKPKSAVLSYKGQRFELGRP